MISEASVKSWNWVTQLDSWGGWSRQVTTANLKVIPSVLTLFSIFWMMATMVDCTCASSPLMDPVASTQKHTSTNPKAGRGRLSRELVLKMVALVGLMERSMLRVRMTALPVEAGRTDGNDPGNAGLARSLLALGRPAAFLGLVAFLGFRILFPSSIVRAMVLVLVMRLALVAWRQSSPSATHRSMEDVLLILVGLLLLAILIKYIGIASKLWTYHSILTHSEAHTFNQKIHLDLQMPIYRQIALKLESNLQYKAKGNPIDLSWYDQVKFKD